MSIDIGSTIDGTIVKLAEYGAIVRLPEGKTGLIHISQIADTFVKDVKDYFREQDRVRVKILGVNSKGRYELSIRQVEQPVRETPRSDQKRTVIKSPPEPIYLGPEDSAGRGLHHASSFEDLMTHYMKDSQEKITEVKRNLDSKRGEKRR